MNSEKLHQELIEFKEQIESLRVKLKNTGEKFLVQKLKEVFEEHPGLTQISWSAYTPYFNDGDTCYFRSGHTWPEIEGEGDGFKYGEPNYEKAKDCITKFMNSFDNDLMLDLFGDHVRILVTKEGMSINEYDDHD